MAKIQLNGNIMGKEFDHIKANRISPQMYRDTVGSGKSEMNFKMESLRF